VNRFLHVTAEDIWVCALPTFHVGGMGIFARAYLSHSAVIPFEAKWSPTKFTELLAGNEATLTSLVPTQVHDLVMAQLAAPQSLRAVVVGGGALDSSLKNQARNLGWPVLASYGLTEAGSQVATEDRDGNLSLLDIWNARTEENGLLSLQGPALAKGMYQNGSLLPLALNGWFTTTDRVVVTNRHLHWQGRIDRTLKVIGELVDLTAIETHLSALANRPIHVLAIPDERRQHLLIASHHAEPFLTEYNHSCAPFARIAGTFDDALIQRSPLGKIMAEATLAKVMMAGWTAMNT
jgi:O-succinylbenzoic acid--CoA ligase